MTTTLFAVAGIALLMLLALIVTAVRQRKRPYLPPEPIIRREPEEPPHMVLRMVRHMVHAIRFSGLPTGIVGILTWKPSAAVVQPPPSPVPHISADENWSPLAEIGSLPVAAELADAPVDAEPVTEDEGPEDPLGHDALFRAIVADANVDPLDLELSFDEVAHLHLAIGERLDHFAWRMAWLPDRLDEWAPGWRDEPGASVHDFEELRELVTA